MGKRSMLLKLKKSGNQGQNVKGTTNSASALSQDLRREFS